MEHRVVVLRACRLSIIQKMPSKRDPVKEGRRAAMKQWLEYTKDHVSANGRMIRFHKGMSRAQVKERMKKHIDTAFEIVTRHGVEGAKLVDDAGVMLNDSDEWIFNRHYHSMLNHMAGQLYIQLLDMEVKLLKKIDQIPSD